MSYIPEYHENYYRVEGTAYNQGKIGIGTINPVQLLHVSGGNFRLDGTGYVNGDLNVTGNLNVYGTTAQFAVSQIIAEDKSIELNVQTGIPIGGGNYSTVAFSNDAGADFGGLIVKSTTTDTTRSVTDKHLVYKTSLPNSGWVSNLRFVVSGNYGKDTLNLSDTTADVGLTIGTDVVLYRSGANVLSTDDRFGITYDGGKNTLHLNNTAVNVGMTIGDVNLYRSATNTLTTDDNFSSTFNGGKTTLALTDTNANVGMTIGGDTNLYRSAANILKTDDSFIVDGAAFTVNSATITLGDTNDDTVTINAGPVNLPSATSAVDALVLGTDANLYRSAADTLKTDDALIVDGNLTVNGGSTSINSSTITLGDASTDTVIINAGPISLVNATAAIDALEFGAGANLANLYRSANDTLRTDDSLIVNTNFNVNGNTTLGDAYADTVLITGKLLRGIRTYSGAGVTTQVSSTQITTDKVIVTGAGILNGALTLPGAIAGMEIEVKNRAGQAINVYASPASDRIFDSSTLYANGAALALASNTNKNFVCAPSGAINVWFT